MSAYVDIGATTNLSQFVVNITAADYAVMSHQYGPNASAPTVKPTGATWIRSDTAFAFGSPGAGLHWWNGSSWALWMDLRGGAVALNDLGTIAMAADMPMGGFKITGLGTPSSNNHAATKLYVDTLIGTAVKADGTVPMTGDLNLDNHNAINSAAPTAGGDLTNKSYVDSHLPVHGTVTSGQHVNLGFMPARLVVVSNTGRSGIYGSAAANIGDTVNLLAVTRRDGTAGSPFNYQGFSVTDNGGLFTGRYLAWRF